MRPTYKITSRIDRDGYKIWGWILSNGQKCAPCWDRRKDAAKAAKFYAAKAEHQFAA